MKFTTEEYDHMHSMVFQDTYPGYKPTVQESPGGDGVWDTEKRYAHVALKYLNTDSSKNPLAHRDGELYRYFSAALDEAVRVHKALGFPQELRPYIHECCLRILDYPPGAVSAEHTDFDLFTLQLYRDRHVSFQRTGVDPADNDISHGIHFGEMAEVAGLRPAMPHRVTAAPVRQCSIVFFALPWRGAPLISAGAWLDERCARSRRETGTK